LGLKSLKGNRTVKKFKTFFYGFPFGPEKPPKKNLKSSVPYLTFRVSVSGSGRLKFKLLPFSVSPFRSVRFRTLKVKPGKKRGNRPPKKPRETPGLPGRKPLPVPKPGKPGTQPENRGGKGGLKG